MVDEVGEYSRQPEQRTRWGDGFLIVKETRLLGGEFEVILA